MNVHVVNIVKNVFCCEGKGCKKVSANSFEGWWQSSSKANV